MDVYEAPNERLNGTEQYLGKRYVEISEKLSDYDWYQWYPIVSCGIFVGYHYAGGDDECDCVVSLEHEIAYEVNEDADPCYILRDLNGYGSSYPVCVDKERAESLCREWSCDDFDDVWREADSLELALYGMEEE